MESQGQKIKITQRNCTLHVVKLAAWAEEMWEGKDTRAASTLHMSNYVQTGVFPLPMTAPCLPQCSPPSSPMSNTLLMLMEMWLFYLGEVWIILFRYPWEEDASNLAQKQNFHTTVNRKSIRIWSVQVI